MADRGRVKIREKKLDDLVKLYQKAYKQVISEIENATLAGKIQKARTMAQIKLILTDLGQDVDKWVKEEIPQYYLDGANHAMQDLRELGIAAGSGMTVIDRQAIAALIDEVNLAFAEGIVGIGRNSRTVLNDVLKRQLQFIIADGKLRGETLRTIAADIKQKLQDQGLSVLVDRGGKRWTFDVYSQMLVRTKAAEARNQGLANRMLENNQDLVQVSNSESTHPACAKWEGKILSVTGETPTGTVLGGGYVVAGSLNEAKIYGLFHPNCQHAINVINIDLAMKTQAYTATQIGAAPSSTPKNKATFNYKSNDISFDLNDFEAQFLADSRVQLTTVSMGGSRSILGSFRYRLSGTDAGAIFVKNPTLDSAEATFFHELGHAIDHKLTNTRLINDESIRSALKSNSFEIIARRLTEGSKLTIDQAKELIKNSLPISRTVNGQYMSRKYFKYVTSADEVFADAYAQFRLAPEEFKKYAPNVYTIFKERFA